MIEKIEVHSKSTMDYVFCPLKNNKPTNIAICRKCPCCRHIVRWVSCEWQTIPQEVATRGWSVAMDWMRYYNKTKDKK